MAIILFWFFLVLIIYVYIGYPLLIMATSRFWPAGAIEKADITPTVSFIISAYNEEKNIAAKIENSLALDYPKDKIEIIVASDGSTDSTNKIVNTFLKDGVKLVALNSNQGKSSAQNRAIAESSGEIIFFTDANAMLCRDAMKKTIRNFNDDKTGCVVGKVTYINETETSVGQEEGLYWRYELLLRKKESEAGNLAVGSGPIMAIRRYLFQPLDHDLGEDFILPVSTALKGYRVVYEPEAVSKENLYQKKAANMFKTKTRIITKDLRGLFAYRAILNPFRYPIYAWGLFSHKLLRWLVPYFLIIIFVLNNLVLSVSPYNFIFGIQLVFYGLAVTGYILQKKSKPVRLFSVYFSFCLVNLAALVGVARFLSGKTAGQWQPVRD